MNTIETGTPSGVRTVVVVGGVAGGMSAAARLRRVDENAHIIVFEASGYVSFANCGLPYYIGNVIEDRQDLILQTPEALAQRFKLDVRVGHRVTSINKDQTVTVLGADGEEIVQGFDQLILAPGAEPRRLGIPGEGRALALRNVEDVDAISAAAQELLHEIEHPQAVIVGAGFIGIEVAENLHRLGFAVTLVNRSQSVLPPLDSEMSAYLEETLHRQGVRVISQATVRQIEAESVTLDNGQVLSADIVIAAPGVAPRVELARSAGLELGPHGGILVDDHQRTSHPAIYAVGDACEKTDINSGYSALLPLAQTANHHARVAADSIVGKKSVSPPTIGVAILGAFGLTVAIAGWNERTARAAGRDVEIIHTHPLNHVGYYPGAEPMHIKLVVDRETDLLVGAQIVGGAGVDKRIDILATAMRAGLTALDLADLELAYAPQFGAAKDPINMVGFVYGNIKAGEKTIQWYDVEDSGLPVVDVRTPAEFKGGHIPGAINIPLDQLRDSLDMLPSGPFIVSCAVGVRGHTAAALLAQRGYDVRNLDGGYSTWRMGNYGAEKE